MKPRHNSPIKKMIYSKGERGLSFLIKSIGIALGIEEQEIKTEIDLYESLIKYCYRHGMSEFDVVDRIEYHIRHNELKIYDFSWVKEVGARAIYFVWISIRCREALHKKESWEKVPPEEHNSLEDYMENIIYTFDESNLHIKERKRVISTLKAEFSNKTKYKHKLIERIKIIEDLNLLNWLWEYLTTKYNLPHYISTPQNSSELSGFILAHIDLWDISDDKKTLILEKAYGA